MVVEEGSLGCAKRREIVVPIGQKHHRVAPVRLPTKGRREGDVELVGAIGTITGQHAKVRAGEHMRRRCISRNWADEEGCPNKGEAEQPGVVHAQ